MKKFKTMVILWDCLQVSIVFQKYLKAIFLPNQKWGNKKIREKYSEKYDVKKVGFNVTAKTDEKDPWGQSY